MLFKIIIIYGLIFFKSIVPAQNRPHFSKETIKLGSKAITIEVADSPAESSYGLMFRRSLGENEGMLFIFNDERPLSFWMKNTFVDLSIAYFGKDKRLIEIKNMKAAKSEMQAHFDTYESSKPAQYALEMRLGWFEKNHIKVGDKLELFMKK